MAYSKNNKKKLTGIFLAALLTFKSDQLPTCTNIISLTKLKRVFKPPHKDIFLKRLHGTTVTRFC